MKSLTILGLLLSVNLFANTTTRTYEKQDFEKSLEEKATIIEMVKNTRALSKFYNDQIEMIFEDIHPSQRPSLVTLSHYDLSLWSVASTFRLGQGDYQFCDKNTETASYAHARVIVGFNTSYKREEVYGLWAVMDLDWDYCENDAEEVTKERLTARFVKWIDNATVDSLLY